MTGQPVTLTDQATTARDLARHLEHMWAWHLLGDPDYRHDPDTDLAWAHALLLNRLTTELNQVLDRLRQAA